MEPLNFSENRVFLTIRYFVLLTIAVASNLYVIYLVGLLYSSAFTRNAAGDGDNALTMVTLRCLGSTTVLCVSAYYWRRLDQNPLVWKARWIHVFGMAFIISAVICAYVLIETEPAPPDEHWAVVVNKVENRQGGYFELADDPSSAESTFIYAVSGEDFRNYEVGDHYSIAVDTIDSDTQPSNEIAIFGGSTVVFAILFLGAAWWERRRKKLQSTP